MPNTAKRRSSSMAWIVADNAWMFANCGNASPSGPKAVGGLAGETEGTVAARSRAEVATLEVVTAIFGERTTALPRTSPLLAMSSAATASRKSFGASCSAPPLLTPRTSGILSIAVPASPRPPRVILSEVVARETGDNTVEGSLSPSSRLCHRKEFSRTNHVGWGFCRLAT